MKNMRYLHTFLLSFVACLAIFMVGAEGHAAVRPIQTQIGAVVDGDTVITREGLHIRLLGINTPEKKRDANPAEEGANAATQFTTKLLEGQNVTIRFDATEKDRYGRYLGHIYLADGTWANQRIIEEGHGHVYSFPDNRKLLNELLTAETGARRAQKGIWQQRRWAILPATPLPSRFTIGRFHIVEGTPIKAANVKGMLYLNYGDNWREDFTVEITPEAQAMFKDQGINPETAFVGKPILARGRLKPVNGVLITVTHPEQIQPASAK